MPQTNYFSYSICIARKRKDDDQYRFGYDQWIWCRQKKVKRQNRYELQKNKIYKVFGFVFINP